MFGAAPNGIRPDVSVPPPMLLTFPPQMFPLKNAAPNGLPGVSMLPPPTTTVGDSVPVTVKPPASAGNHAPTFSFFNNPYAIPKPQLILSPPPHPPPLHGPPLGERFITPTPLRPPMPLDVRSPLCEPFHRHPSPLQLPPPPGIPIRMPQSSQNQQPQPQQNVRQPQPVQMRSNHSSQSSHSDDDLEILFEHINIPVQMSQSPNQQQEVQRPIQVQSNMSHVFTSVPRPIQSHSNSNQSRFHSNNLGKLKKLAGCPAYSELWVETTSSTGKTYFYKPFSSESVWTRPASGVVIAQEELQRRNTISRREEALKQVHPDNLHLIENSNAEAGTSQSAASSTGQNWARVFSSNQTTHNSTWEHPRPSELANRLDLDSLDSKIRQQQKESETMGARKKNKKLKRLRAQERKKIAQNKQPLPLREIRLDPAILAKRKKIQAELQAQNKRDKIPFGERLKKFRELLEDKNVSATSTWECEMSKIMFDSRFILLDAAQRKAEFEAYARIMRIRSTLPKRTEEKKAAKKKKEAEIAEKEQERKLREKRFDQVIQEKIPFEERLKLFGELLKDKEVSATSTWEREISKVSIDSRFLFLDEAQRKAAFETFKKENAGIEQSKSTTTPSIIGSTRKRHCQEELLKTDVAAEKAASRSDDVHNLNKFAKSQDEQSQGSADTTSKSQRAIRSESPSASRNQKKKASETIAIEQVETENEPKNDRKFGAIAENDKSTANSCAREKKSKLATKKPKKTWGQSMALEYLIEIERLKETIRKQTLEHSAKETEWKNEKQLLLENLNDEREKAQLLSTRITELEKNLCAMNQSSREKPVQICSTSSEFVKNEPFDVDEPQTTSAQPIGPLQERGKHHVHANVEVQGPNLSPNSEISIGADEVPISEDQPPDFNSNSDPPLTQHVEKEASLLPSLSSHANKHTKSSQISSASAEFVKNEPLDMDEPPVPQPTSVQPIEPLQLQEKGKHRIHADAMQHSSTVAVQGPNLSPNSESSIVTDEVPISEDQPPDFNSNSAPTQHVEKEASTLSSPSPSSSSSSHNKHTKSSELTIVEERTKTVEKFDEAVNNNKEQIHALFPRFPIGHIRLFDEYAEAREKFGEDPASEEIFESVIKSAEALKLLEAIFRYTELVLFEVKRDQFIRRSERNFISWAEEQRSKLFAKNPFKLVNLRGIMAHEVVQFFTEHQTNLKKTFFGSLSEAQIEMLEKFGAKVLSVNVQQSI